MKAPELSTLTKTFYNDITMDVHFVDSDEEPAANETLGMRWNWTLSQLSA